MQPNENLQTTRPVELNEGNWHPNVLLVHWELYARTGQWPAALAVAQALVQTLPEEPIGWIYRAFSLHKVEGADAARKALLPAARKFE